jgi:YVTN family beta-propeller protein
MNLSYHPMYVVVKILSAFSGGWLAVTRDLQRVLVDNVKVIVYVVRFGARNENGTVFVIDVREDAILASITVGRQPLQLSLGNSPFYADNHLYVANTWSSTISIVDTVNYEVLNTIDLTGQFRDGVLWTMEMTPDGSQIFVTYDTIHYISIIDTATREVRQHVPVKGQFHEIAFVHINPSK